MLKLTLCCLWWYYEITKSGFALGSKTEKTPKSRDPIDLLTQALYTNVYVYVMRKSSDAYVAPQYCQQFGDLTQKHPHPSLRNHSSSLGPMLSH